MAIATGAQGSGGTRGIFASRRKVQMRDGLAELEPDINPITLVLRKTKSKTIKGPKWEWLEHDRFDDTTQVNGAQTSGDTSIEVDDGSVAAVNQLVRNQRTGEVIRVTAIATNTWTVTRSIGGTAAAAMNDDDYLMILGTAFNENSSAPDPRAKDETTGFNYTQIARDTFGASGTLIATDLYGTGKQIMNERASQRARDHNVYIEKTLLFGERSEDVSGNYALRTCGGLDEFITQTSDFGGAFSMQSAFDALEVGMRYGSKSKMLVCSRSAASNISLEALDKVRTTVSEKTFGINVSMLESPHGKIAIVRHDLLTGGEYATRAYLLDMANLGFCKLQGRDTALYEGLESNGTDGEVHGWLSEFTLERGLASTHQTWLNVSNG
jgi:hypothetical protein